MESLLCWFTDENDNLVPLVDLQGRFLKGDKVPELFAGKYVKNEYYKSGEAPEKSWDVELAILLKTENKAFKVEKYVHSYPHCWRTDAPGALLSFGLLVCEE